MVEEPKSVLIVDDQANFARTLSFGLEQEGYRVEITNTIDGAINRLRREPSPMFILADRMLEGEAIEQRELKPLSDVASDSHIVIYTAVDELTEAQKYIILDKGAVRVLGKQEIDEMVKNIKLLTQEFDELISISRELQAFTTEREKIAAALVGSNVGVTIIDSHYRCWFGNAAIEKIMGRPCSGTLCWRFFHAHAVSSGPCWGCSIRKVLESGRSADRLVLTRSGDRAVKWLSTRSNPIYAEGTNKIIAVREGVTDDTDAIVKELSSEMRLWKIAQGLIHIGFGRVRIHKVEANQRIPFCAAAAQTDDPDALESQYEKDLPLAFELDEQCHYTHEAVKRRVGYFIREWNPDWGPSRHADALELDPPYFIVPVWNSHGILRGLLCADFVGIEAGLRDTILKRYANEETLEWLQEDYATEILKAFEAKERPGQRDLDQIVQRAKIGVGAARSVHEAIRELRNAFECLLPDCRFSVRVCSPEGLKEYEDLCFGPREKEVPELIPLSNKKSLAVLAVNTKRVQWIDCYQAHLHVVLSEDKPAGYSDPDVESCTHIPLMFENFFVIGSLSIDSKKPIQWEEGGYKRPLLELSNLVALVVRDVALQESLEQKSTDLAAMIAYSITVSGDAIWRHWAAQRLAEASAATYQCRQLLKKEDNRDKIHKTLLELEDIIDTVSRGRPPDQQEPICALGEVISRLHEKHRDREVALVLPSPEGLPKVKLPKFHVRNILQILLDNAVQAIKASGTGTEIRLMIHEKDSQFCKIQVCDDGPGIPADIKPKLFREPVYSTKGRGIGLLIARGTALQYGGDLYLQPTEQGACFTLKLPMA